MSRVIETMSLYIVALGLAAGYLMRLKPTFEDVMEDAQAKYHSAAKPSPEEPTSETIRLAQRAKNLDTDMSVKQTDEHRGMLELIHQQTLEAVQAYENPYQTQQIEGVYFSLK